MDKQKIKWDEFDSEWLKKVDEQGTHKELVTKLSEPTPFSEGEAED
ncbi:hypothetical protein [Ornithinibacillus halophilus]|uniref:Uncharacterized protein n=1 Tax=Ornithinibacillus halophilus TaxID=930117 RepID=A0A1M5GTT6_9BACI|nr:hypothetical protein [Ornithinibacillus halophilus]SHG07075.1 hypothetical protein SAMN05216225_101452 [Ornithinibacillus halophilus]